MAPVRFPDRVEDYPPAQRFGPAAKLSPQAPRRRAPSLPPGLMDRSSPSKSPFVGLQCDQKLVARGHDADRTEWMTVYPSWACIHRADQKKSSGSRGKRLYGEEAEAIVKDFEKSLIAKHGDAKTGFNAIDLNGNGLVSGAEFTVSVGSWYKGDAGAVFKALNVHRNGSIDFEDFSNFSRKQPARNPLKEFLATRGMRMSSSVPTGVFDGSGMTSHNPTSLFGGTFQDRQDYHGLRVTGELAQASGRPQGRVGTEAFNPLGSRKTTGTHMPPILLKTCPAGSGCYASR